MLIPRVEPPHLPPSLSSLSIEAEIKGEASLSHPARQRFDRSTASIWKRASFQSWAMKFMFDSLSARASPFQLFSSWPLCADLRQVSMFDVCSLGHPTHGGRCYWLQDRARQKELRPTRTEKESFQHPSSSLLSSPLTPSLWQQNWKRTSMSTVWTSECTRIAVVLANTGSRKWDSTTTRRSGRNNERNKEKKTQRFSCTFRKHHLFYELLRFFHGPVEWLMEICESKIWNVVQIPSTAMIHLFHI